MKKLILTTILASTFAISQAQVSMYGVLDTGVQSYKNGGDQVYRASDSLLSTSRIGLRGSENVGQGFKTSFQLEGQLTPSTGSLGGPTNEVFNRESWVGVGHPLYGEVKVGRTTLTDASDMDSLAWQAGNFSLMPVNGNDVELGSYQKNVVKYTSPIVSGVSFQAARTNDASGSTVSADATQTAFSLNYTKGPLKVGAGYQQNEGVGVAKRDSTSFGVAYDFSKFSVGAAYVRGDNSVTSDVTSEAGVVSARYPVKPGFTAHAVYAFTKDGTKATDNRGSGYSVVLTQDFSKRTTLYTAYTSVFNQANSSMSMVGTSVPTTPGMNTAGLSAGIRHVF